MRLLRDREAAGLAGVADDAAGLGRVPGSGLARVDPDHPVREPGSSLTLGYIVRMYGDLVIDALTDRPIASATLLSVVQPVERGYRVGPVFKQFSLPMTPQIQSLFLENLRVIYNGGDLTQDLVRQAGEATREIFEEHIAKAKAEYEAGRRQQQQGGALPPRRVPGGGGQPYSGNGKRARPSDFGNKFNTYGV